MMPLTTTFARRAFVGRAALLALPLAFALAGCAGSFDTNVSRFQHELPAPAGQTFAVVAEDPRNSGGLEFAQYASLVGDQLHKIGYVPGDPATSDLVVEFDYGVDKGRDKISSTGGGYDPFWGPWRGYGYGGWGPGGGFYGRRGWGYGWYDPWFNDIDVTTVYTSGVSVKIKRRSDGQRVFEGRAEAVSPSNRLSYVVPKLIEALFTGFPGHTGETVRISIQPEKKAKKK
ncbi:hypothetical protein Y88_2271 [Novosphingobium nitrogenifigens DSM 19370]|uniref:DUF4136 domain-containing protein n=2 Tax=Novosphingobium nitrogenifigens TaxID=378548 RepID=F1Z650_9SPHN|nr:hypothetical protein Y88_2271 [Novosphingobium nitrogenifigens DSM 19370]